MEQEAGGEGEPMRGVSLDTTDDESAAGRERPTVQVKEKRYYFQLKWLTLYPWLRYDGSAMLCECCRQCGPSIVAVNFLPKLQGLKECC